MSAEPHREQESHDGETSDTAPGQREERPNDGDVPGVLDGFAPYDDLPEDDEDGGEASDDQVTAKGLLRQALVDDQDPRFPRWLPLPGIACAAGWAGYDAIAMDGAFLATFVWPGVAIFALATLAAWFGWQLEID